MQSQGRGLTQSGVRVAVGIAPLTYPLADRVARPAAVRTHAQAETVAPAQVYWAATLFVICWSFTYLVRQPGVLTSVLAEPFSLLGNFAIEGMVLSLAWLALLVVACLAVLSGEARLDDQSKW